MSFECVLACFDSSSLHDCYDLFFFFNDTATTEIYTLSLHDALPIWAREHGAFPQRYGPTPARLSPQAVLQHVAMGEGARRVDPVVELGDHALKLDVRRPDGEGQVVEPVGVVRQQESLDAARAPVAVQPPQ